MSKPMTIEDVQMVANHMRHLKASSDLAPVPIDIGLELCILAERALSMPDGLDERARRVVEFAMSEASDYSDRQDEIHTIRALVAENANLRAGIKQLNEQWNHGQDAIGALIELSADTTADVEAERLREALRRLLAQANDMQAFLFVHNNYSPAWANAIAEAHAALTKGCTDA